jgi:hypothetical protein
VISKTGPVADAWYTEIDDALDGGLQAGAETACGGDRDVVVQDGV